VKQHPPIGSPLRNLAVVLRSPKYPENVGAAARVARNMGVGRLLVVAERPPDHDRAMKMATHHAADLIEHLEFHQDLGQALSPFGWVAATTARTGRQRRNLVSPRQAAADLVPLLAENRVALLFGPEDRGLTNQDLAHCNTLITIPTADFSSLNLAQAVAVCCYEFLVAAMEQQHGQGSSSKVVRLAEHHELQGMYAHLEEALRRVGFLREADGEYWMKNIRSFLGRVGLTAREARLIRGVCRQFIWYEEQREKGG